jgi:hypothetical protein
LLAEGGVVDVDLAVDVAFAVDVLFAVALAFDFDVSS